MTDTRVFPQEILGEQARDRVKLVDFKENVQNEAEARGPVVYERDIQANTGDETPNAIQYKGKRDERDEVGKRRAEQEVSLLAFEVGGLRITRQPISDYSSFLERRISR